MVQLIFSIDGNHCDGDVVETQKSATERRKFEKVRRGSLGRRLELTEGGLELSIERLSAMWNTVVDWHSAFMGRSRRPCNAILQISLSAASPCHCKVRIVSAKQSDGKKIPGNHKKGPSYRPKRGSKPSRHRYVE
jgi:hypothetical protein